ncbi:YfiR family protein [Methylomicrobium sp. RS1]|jgi:hypothetical protein|nr:YfiR family protein [Methylomicrobium sp. RS1]
MRFLSSVGWLQVFFDRKGHKRVLVCLLSCSEARQALPTICLSLSILLTIILLISPAQARAESGSAEAVKVAFLFNVLRFIEWPGQNDQAAFNLCTSAKDALGDKLLVLKNKSIDGKPINLLRGVSMDVLKTCHLVFVGKDEALTIAHELRGFPVLTVGDHKDFVREGGMIGLLLDGNRLKFEVNLQAAKESRIRIFATLLKLAKTIVGAS